MNLFEAIFTQAPLDRAAIFYEQRQISYAQVRDQTLTAARVLRELKVDRGERVALLLNDSPEFIASFIAICSSGAIAVPINMGLRLEEQRAILNDCTAKFAIIEASLGDALLADAPAKLPHLKELVAVSRDDDQRDLVTVIQRAHRESREEIGGTSTIASFAALMDQAKASMQDHPSQMRFPEPADNQPAFILYTSGSTGEPKGAVHRQADIFYTNETYCREVLRLRQGDRLFSSSRLPFAYGFGNSFTFPLLNGGTTILCREKPKPEVISQVLAEYKPTVFFAVPVVYRLLLDHHQDHTQGPGLDCSSLRLCISAGEALPAHLGEEWKKTFGVEVLDGIGSTEMLHMWMSNHEGEVRYGSSGKLLEGYEARLLDQEGTSTAGSAEGNLWVKGASAALGYWKRPDTTAGTFVDGWVRTGDLYRNDANGYWYHMGRSDDCFKSSGQWVSPVEVEGVLLRYQGVSRAAVVEAFDVDGLPCACAFIIREDVADDNLMFEEGLRELARASMPPFKRPRQYVFVDELPYTTTGKIQRFKLRERLRTVRSQTSNVQSQASANNH
ncbi:MAG: benzoate-CoA ligase family protein [Acidobacteriota bacterium]|nr:benzoate-CoA ligase family protein [Acidobacteriota bacterium]